MTIKIAILGFGTIGSGVAEVIDINRDSIEKQIKSKIEVAHILDLREFPDSPYADVVTSDFDKIISDKDVKIVIEAMGGAHPAYDFSLAAINAGKHVVTSNKEVVAKFGKELLEAAAQNGVRYLFEASVGGGIPVIRPMSDSLAGNKIVSVQGILNGTTNYILTEMAEKGKSFDDALTEAQQKGYAERDPSADIEGVDSKRKIMILAALSFGMIFNENDVKARGITHIKSEDVASVAQIGGKIKLVGFARKCGEDKIIMGVEPCVALRDNPLCSVDGVYNSILVNANALGSVMFYGSGAGKLPTASAVVADIMDILLNPEKKETVSFRDADSQKLDDGYDENADYFLVSNKELPENLRADKISDSGYIFHDISRNTLKSMGYESVYRVL